VYGNGESWKTGSSLKRERQEAYIEWLLTPKAERQPRTKQDLAEMLGVTPMTLRNYTRDPFFQQELSKRGKAINKVERASDVLDALYRRAIDVDEGAPAVTAAKVWLEYTDKAVADMAAADLEEMPKDELLALIEKVYDKVADSD
jgi:hypothetical protein